MKGLIIEFVDRETVGYCGGRRMELPRESYAELIELAHAAQVYDVLFHSAQFLCETCKTFIVPAQALYWVLSKMGDKDSDLIYELRDAIAKPSLYLFGLLQSSMHMAWMRLTAGRLESRYQYSASMVYNTFPWPNDPTEKQKAAIEDAAQGVLDARAAYPDASLADLYDPVAMPPDLRKAHQALDKAVDGAYGKRTFTSDAERVAFLFELYHKYTSLLPAPVTKKGRKKK